MSPTTQARRIFFWRTVLVAGGLAMAGSALAQSGGAVPTLPLAPAPAPLFTLPPGGLDLAPSQAVSAVQVMLGLTVLSLAPALLISVTSFTRTIIVLTFVRQALGIPQLPPNQILVGLALFLTWFVMNPVIEEVKVTAYQPLTRNQITTESALDLAAKPIQKFMLRYTREKDLSLFLTMSGDPMPSSAEEVSLRVLIPAFMISELKAAFQIGFMIYVPFLLIDLIVSSILMAMGMMVLPPSLISTPLKIMLFVLVDGWNLLIGSLFRSFS